MTTQERKSYEQHRRQNHRLQLGPVTIMRGTATPGRDVTHPECFGRFTVVALSYGGAIRKCMRRVAQMCAKHSACEQLDRQEARA